MALSATSTLPGTRFLGRLAKWSEIFAVFTIVLYVAFCMLARGDQAVIHALAQECSRVFAIAAAVSVFSRLAQSAISK